MKKSILLKAVLTSFLTVFIVFIATPEVMSVETVWVHSVPGYYGVGGEFTLYPSLGLQGVLSGYVDATKNIGTDGGPNFQSFCIEHREYVYEQNTYNVFKNDRAISGNIDLGNQSPNNDPISKGTAYLYHLFQIGQLSGYNYTPGNGRISSADALQYMIWYLEDEEDTYDTSNPFAQVLKDKFDPNSLANALQIAKLDNNGLYPVSALNLYGLDGGLAQDLLVCDPVPEPATMVLLCSGLIALAGLARKKFNKRQL